MKPDDAARRDPNNLQAWCYACEEMYEQEDGLTETFRDFMKMADVCAACYAATKTHHTLPKI